MSTITAKPTAIEAILQEKLQNEKLRNLVNKIQNVFWVSDHNPNIGDENDQITYAFEINKTLVALNELPFVDWKIYTNRSTTEQTLISVIVTYAEAMIISK